MENNREYGYTDSLYDLNTDFKIYARFIGVLIKLKFMPIRHGQVLMSNFGQNRFQQLRDEVPNGN